MELKDVDMNLLLVFHELLNERSVSAVAEKLDMTQPGVSNALKRLRLLLGDELFLRTRRGMEPTPFAQSLAEPIGYALTTIFNSLNEVAHFDPATSKRKFTLGMTDIGEVYFLPQLMALLAQQAPGITVSTVRNSTINLQEEMEAGHVDLALGLLPQLKAGYFQRRLFRQPYVCLFRKGHPLDLPDGRDITLEQFEAAEHVVVISQGSGHGFVDQSMERLGIRRNIRLVVPHFVAVGHILGSSTMVATVPERFAMKSVEPFGLKYVKHPVTALPEAGINLFWHARFNKEPGNQWLRGLIFDTFSDGGAIAA